jgi:hypothetical protein
VGKRNEEFKQGDECWAIDELTIGRGDTLQTQPTTSQIKTGFALPCYPLLVFSQYGYKSETHI